MLQLTPQGTAKLLKRLRAPTPILQPPAERPTAFGRAAKMALGSTRKTLLTGRHTGIHAPSSTEQLFILLTLPYLKTKYLHSINM